MDRLEALEKAERRSMTTLSKLLVIKRTDHPHIDGDHFYIIASDQKRAWTPGESVVATFNDGESIGSPDA